MLIFVSFKLDDDRHLASLRLCSCCQGTHDLYFPPDETQVIIFGPDHLACQMHWFNWSSCITHQILSKQSIQALTYLWFTAKLWAPLHLIHFINSCISLCRMRLYLPLLTGYHPRSCLPSYFFIFYVFWEALCNMKCHKDKSLSFVGERDYN